MPKKEIAFFAYCRDNDKEIPFLKYLKNEIEKKSNNRISVIIDVFSFKISEDFAKREKEILSSDCVVVFFTPEYKVYRSYKNDK